MYLQGKQKSILLNFHGILAKRVDKLHNDQNYLAISKKAEADSRRL